MQTMSVYMTFPDPQAASDAAEMLLDLRLIACANILPGARSLYRWEGRITSAEETVMIAKTTAEAVDKVIDKVKGLHVYTCPCITAWAVDKGHAPFLEWVQSEVAP